MKKSVYRPLPLTNCIQMLKLEKQGQRREQQSKPSQPSHKQDMLWRSLSPMAASAKVSNPVLSNTARIGNILLVSVFYKNPSKMSIVF